MQAQWTAIILAGQRPGVDPLADHFGIEWKALVKVGGEAMITRVVRTLNDCPQIAHIIVLTQEPVALAAAVEAGGGAKLLHSNAGISTSIMAVAGRDAAWPILVTTADHPLLTPAMVSEFIEQSAGDLSVAMVEQTVMFARFPDAKRTWLRFADGAWSGANLFALITPKTRSALEFWAEAEQDRKKAFKLFMHFGPLFALRAITRTIGLRNGLAKAGKRMGLDARLVAMSDPVAAIDVDKVADHEIAEQLLKS